MKINDTLPIADELKLYLENKFKLLKYESIDKASAVFAEVATDVVIALIFFIAFIFFTITLAFLAATLLRSVWEGFGCITLLYILIALFARLLKIRLQNICIRRFIEKLFTNRNT